MNSRMTIRKKYRKGQGGQVLACALIFMIIVVIAVFLLFDLHTVIRGKVKGQAAVDAAALAGATWQQHTLNLLGELNLVKATTILTTDFVNETKDGQNQIITHMKSPEDYTDEDGKFKAAEFYADAEKALQDFHFLERELAMLTQMQTRVSFVLPLIGFGAAQQAAKNNGLDPNSSACESVREMYNDIMDGDYYGDPMIAQPIINGYAWRMPYAQMIYTILNSGSKGDFGGIAVGTNTMRIGTPILVADPPNRLTSYLTSRRFYEAILANSWCELKDILELNYDGAWWGNFKCEFADTFLKESEILPVRIDFFQGSTPYHSAKISSVFPRRFDENSTYFLLGDLYDNYDPYDIRYDSDTGTMDYSRLQFDSNGIPIRKNGDTDLNFNILPEFTWCVYDETWTNYDDDQKKFWKNYLRAEFREGYEYFSGALSWFHMQQDLKTITGNLSEGKGGLGQKFSVGDGRSAAEMRSAEHALRTSVHEIETDALAKPFGRIKTENGEYKPPFFAGNMVLPVFQDVALLPVSLEPLYGHSQVDHDWILFLKEYIPLLGDSKTLEETWEKVMEHYSGHSHKFNRYHQALVKLNNPEWRQKGIDWLNRPIAHDKDGKPVKFKKDNCNYWPSGGGGHRAGPSKLH